MAIGDATNDLPMFAMADVAVAVANAEPALVETGIEVTRRAFGAGVAEALAASSSPSTDDDRSADRTTPPVTAAHVVELVAAVDAADPDVLHRTGHRADHQPGRVGLEPSRGAAAATAPPTTTLAASSKSASGSALHVVAVETAEELGKPAVPRLGGVEQPVDHRHRRLHEPVAGEPRRAGALSCGHTEPQW